MSSLINKVKSLLGRESAQQKAEKYHFKLYKRYPITLVKGKGVYVEDENKNRYLDALAGIAVNGLGHSHPQIVKAVKKQAEKLIHVSNFYYNQPQSDLAEMLVKISGLDRAFFCNSGAEAIEGSIKIARKYGNANGKRGPIIAMENCFHGRTLGAIAMGKEKYQKGFAPIPPGFDRVPFNNIEALEAKVSDQTVAIIIETVQGEGGIHPVDLNFLLKARQLCDTHDIPLILDEVQCGIARTGKMFAWEHYEVEPDIVALAKALGSGFPIGAVLATEKFASALEYGDHGTTYGGNPLACAAAKATIQTILDEDLVEAAREKGNYMMNRLRDIATNWEAIKEVRGLGLMIGVELNFPGAPVVKKMLAQGVLSNCASNNVIRLVPPVIITKEEIDKLIEVLVESIKMVEEDVT